MKIFLLFLLPIFAVQMLSAQHYEISSPNDTLTKTSDTLFFTVPVQAGIWSDAELTILYQGHFYYNDQYLTVYSSNWQNIGQTSNFYYNWCTIDSLTLTIPKDSILAWTAGGNISFYLISSSNANVSNCSINMAKIRLSYNYCTFGTPVALADITVSDTLLCPYDSPLLLTGTPAGGTFSGPGVAGNHFNPAGLSGQYIIHYVATDAIGCISDTCQMLTILPSPLLNDTVICPSTSALLHQIYPVNSLWFTNPGLTGTPDTTDFFNTGTLTQPTTWYVQDLSSIDYFEVTSFADTNAFVMDFDAIISDDRGGIAITPDHVFFIGDGGIGRFNHSLDVASAEHFAINDGIFSDLKSGRLMSLWNGSYIINDDNYSDYYYVKGFQQLDSNMNVIGYLPLSQTIEMGDYNDYSGIFSGYGFTILYSGTNYHSYVVNNISGSVTDLGDSYSPDMYDSENWANWGIAEFDGTDYSVVYRDNNGDSLTRLNYTTGSTLSAADFSDLSDCATVGYSPWDKRWYLHFEGGSQWYGDDETGCYLNATDSIHSNPGTGFGCYNDVTVSMNTIDIGPSDTAICINEPLTIFAGTGYQSYTWNGVNNNFNVCFADTAGTYTVEVIDNMGCTLIDAITVTVDSCTGINDPEANLINIYPNPANDFVNIEIPSGILEGNSTIAIADAQGRIVLKEIVSAENGYNYQLNVQSLDKGLYQLIITSEKKQFAYRLIRQ